MGRPLWRFHGRAVGSDIDIQVILIAIHKVGERGEQVVGIGGSGCGLGVVLHAERRDVQQLDALRRSVIEVHVRKADEAKLLIAHHGGHAGTDPEAQIAVCRMLIIATGKLRHYFA